MEEPILAAGRWRPSIRVPSMDAGAGGPVWLRRGLVWALTGTLVAGSFTAAHAVRAPEAGAPAEAATAQAEGSAAPPPVVAPEPVPAAPPATAPAYRVVSRDGGVFTHGGFDFEGSAAGATTSPVVGLAQPVDGDGYWLASADGGVFAFGDVAFHGSAAGQTAAPVVDITASPSAAGYRLATADGGVFTFGDASFHGAGLDLGLSAPVVALATTPSGAGYWMATADGGVFTFGDASFLGAVADQATNARIVDLVPTPTGAGYYLVAADGGVFTFGDAVFQGAAIDQPRRAPIADMALQADGLGYWLLSADGGVYSFGGAPFLGAPASEGTRGTFAAIAAGIGREVPPFEEPAAAPAEVAPAAGAAPAPDAGAAPPAPALNTAGGVPGVGGPGKAKKAKAASAKSSRPLDGEFGWDVSYPQCGAPLPEEPAAYRIIGVNGGRAFRHNRCLAEQWAWARSHGPAGIYVNVHFPHSPEEMAFAATSDRQPDCNGAVGCVAYNFGLNAIRDALAYARSQGVDAPFVWLDVEQLNHWAPQPELNAVVLRGAVDAAAEAGLGVGVYSTPYQFRKIAGGDQFYVPVWSAGAPGLEAIADYCANRGFGGGPVVLVQLLPGRYDPNVGCPGAGPMSTYFKV